MNTAWPKWYFALLVLAVTLIPISGSMVAAITAVASEFQKDQGWPSPTIIKFCTDLGPVGLACVGAVFSLVIVAMFGWRKTDKATVISTIVLLVWLGFSLVAFLTSIRCMIVNIIGMK
jgi:hypothetical protein